MSELFSDDQAEIERLFLWQDIGAVLRANSQKLGIQAPFVFPLDSESGPTRLVLAEAPKENEDTIQMWAEVAPDSLISNVSLIYTDTDGREVFNYMLTPWGIKQYSPEPSPLDAEDLMDLRGDITHADWDEQQSQECAANLLFFG